MSVLTTFLAPVLASSKSKTLTSRDVRVLR